MARRTPESAFGGARRGSRTGQRRKSSPEQAVLQTAQGEAGKEDLAVYSLKGEIIPMPGAEGSARPCPGSFCPGTERPVQDAVLGRPSPNRGKPTQKW